MPERDLRSTFRFLESVAFGITGFPASNQKPFERENRNRLRHLTA